MYMYVLVAAYFWEWFEQFLLLWNIEVKIFKLGQKFFHKRESKTIGCNTLVPVLTSLSSSYYV